ncbi:hypothetical protein [Janibacter sp. LM]|uniref:hypothetical protein n=1 Tax=Janibacter sp. LM TaxID=3144845 RepID=UPI0031F70FB7
MTEHHAHTPVATITSPGHAIGVGALITVAVLSVQLLAGMATPHALGATIGVDAASTAVPAVMLVAALGSLIAVWVVPRLNYPARAMRVEAACKATLAAMLLLYGYSLTSFHGWSSGPATQTFTWGLGWAFVARTVQILHDARTASRATAAQLPACPTPLGDPDRTEG